MAASIDYGGFLYLNPELILSRNLVDVDSAKSFLDAHVLSGGLLSDFHFDRSSIPQDFDGRVYLADTGLVANVSRMNRDVCDLMRRNGWTEDQIMTTSVFVRNINRTASFDGLDTFTITDLITDLTISSSDRVMVVVNDFSVHVGTVRAVDYNGRKISVIFDVGRAPPANALKYLISGIAVVDPNRIGGVNYVRGAHVGVPYTSVPQSFNLDLYHLLYPETRLLSLVDAYANYISNNKQYNHQAGKIDDIRLTAGQLVVKGDAAFFGEMVISDDLEVNAPSAFNEKVTLTADLESSCNITTFSLHTSNLYVKDVLKVEARATFSNDLEVLGTASFSNDVRLAKSLVVDGSATFSNDLEVLGTASFSNDLEVWGDVRLASNLVVDRSAEFRGRTSFLARADFSNIAASNVSASNILSSNLGALACSASSLDVTGFFGCQGPGVFSKDLEVIGVFRQRADSFFGSACSIDGELAASNKVTIKGTLTCESNTSVTKLAHFHDNVTVDGLSKLSGVVVLGTFSASNHATFADDVEALARLTVAGNARFSGSNTFDGALVVANPLLQIPMGATSARPANASAGAIRYNTDLHTFEGMSSSSNWTSLGGVVDTDRDTFVAAEDSNRVLITTLGLERVVVTSAGNVGIGTSAPSCKLDVSGSACFSNISTASVSNVDAFLVGLSNQVTTIISNGLGGSYSDPPFVISTATASTSNVAELRSVIEIDETESKSETFTVRAFATHITNPGFSNHVQFSRFLRKVDRWGDSSGVFTATVQESGGATTSFSNILLAKHYNTTDFSESPSNLGPEEFYRVQIMVENSLGYKTILKNHESVIADVAETDDVFAPTFAACNIFAVSSSNIRVEVYGISDIGVGKTKSYAIATDPLVQFTDAEIDKLATNATITACNLGTPVSFDIGVYFDHPNGQAITMSNYSEYNAHIVIYDTANPANKTISSLGTVRTFDSIPPTYDSPLIAPKPVPRALEVTICNVEDDTHVLLYPLTLPDNSNTSDADNAYATVQSLGIPPISITNPGTKFLISDHYDGVGLKPFSEYTKYNPFAILVDASNNTSLAPFTTSRTLDETPPTIVSGTLASTQLASREILVDQCTLRDDHHDFDVLLFAFDSSNIPDSNVILDRINNSTYTENTHFVKGSSANSNFTVSLRTSNVITTSVSATATPLVDSLEVFPMLFVHDKENRNAYPGNFSSFASPKLTLDLAPPTITIALSSVIDSVGQPDIRIDYSLGDAVEARLLLNSTGLAPQDAESLLLDANATPLAPGSFLFTSNAIENTSNYAWIAAKDSLSNLVLEGPCNVFVPGIAPVITGISTSLGFDNIVEVVVNAEDKGRTGLAKTHLEFSTSNTPSNLLGGFKSNLSGDSDSNVYRTGILEQGVPYYFHAIAVDAAGNQSASYTQQLTDNNGVTYYLSGPTFDVLAGTSNFQPDKVFFTFEVDHFFTGYKDLGVASIKAVLATSNQDSNVVDSDGLDVSFSNSNNTIVPTDANGVGLSNITTTGTGLNPSTRYAISVLAVDIKGNETLEHLPIFTLDDQKPTIKPLVVTHTAPSNVDIEIEASDSYDGVLDGVHVLVTTAPFVGDITQGPATFVQSGNSNIKHTLNSNVDPSLDTYVYAVAEDRATTFGAPQNLFSETASNITLAPKIASSPIFQTGSAPTTSFRVLAGEYIRSVGGAVSLSDNATGFTAYLAVYKNSADKPGDFATLTGYLIGNASVSTGAVVAELLSFQTLRMDGAEETAINIEYALDGSAAIKSIKSLVHPPGSTADPTETDFSGNANFGAHSPDYANTIRLVKDSNGSALKHSTNYKVAVLIEDVDGNLTLETLDTVTLDATKPTINTFSVVHNINGDVDVEIEAADSNDGSISSIYYYISDENIDPNDLTTLGDKSTTDSVSTTRAVPTHCNTFVHAVAEDSAADFGAIANILSDKVSSITRVPDTFSAEPFTVTETPYAIHREPSLVRADAGPLEAYLVLFQDNAPLDNASLSNAVSSRADFNAPVSVIDETVSISVLEATSAQNAISIDYELGGTADITKLETFVVLRGETIDPDVDPPVQTVTGATLSKNSNLSFANLTDSTLYTIGLRATDKYGATAYETRDAFTRDTLKPSVATPTIVHSGGSNVSVYVTGTDANDGEVSEVYCIISETSLISPDPKRDGLSFTGGFAQFSGSVPSHCNTYVYAQVQDEAASFGGTANLLSDIVSDIVEIPVFSTVSVSQSDSEYTILLDVAGSVEPNGPTNFYLALFPENNVPGDAPSLSNDITKLYTSCNVFL